MNKEKKDQLEVEVLPDGVIKVSTDKISLPNHLQADQFLRELARLAGGTVKREAKHPHAHNHQQQGLDHEQERHH